MKTDVLLYLENHISDNNLELNSMNIPEMLGKELIEIDAISNIYYSIPETYTGKLAKEKVCFTRNEKDDVSFLKNFFSNMKSDNIVKIYCDSPFLDAEIIKEMIDLHVKYLAEFTYSENLPEGYSCEIISKELVESIPNSEDKMLPLRDIIKSNINNFDVEIYYKDPDIRDKRIFFRSGSPRDKKIMSNIYTKLNKIPKYTDVKDFVNNNPDVLYTGPSYVEIELTGRCELNCIFCYRDKIKTTRPDMDSGLFKKLLKDMECFELPYSICFGGSGEPMMNENFYEILDLTVNESLIENIIIETNGLHADNNFKNYLLSNGDAGIKTIFNINGMDEDTYTAIHQKDYFKRVFENITSIKEALQDNGSIYIQVSKINETEVFLDKFYDFWENYKIPIILQKQNTYLGRVEDRRYSDLSPLERIPCWHLQRDIFALSDGRIIFCKQDIDGDFSKGNIMDESIHDIWVNAKKYFIDNYNENYSTCPDCMSCDEWYTFNL